MIRANKIRAQFKGNRHCKTGSHLVNHLIQASGQVYKVSILILQDQKKNVNLKTRPYRVSERIILRINLLTRIDKQYNIS